MINKKKKKKFRFFIPNLISEMFSSSILFIIKSGSSFWFSCQQKASMNHTCSVHVLQNSVASRESDLADSALPVYQINGCQRHSVLLQDFFFFFLSAGLFHCLWLFVTTAFSDFQFISIVLASVNAPHLSCLKVPMEFLDENISVMICQRKQDTR